MAMNQGQGTDGAAGWGLYDRTQEQRSGALGKWWREESGDEVLGELTQITPTETASNYFGFSTAISADGNTLVVGSYTGSVGARVYSRVLGEWVYVTTLSHPSASADLGLCVAISSDGNVIAVASPSHNSNNYQNRGSVWIFQRTVASEPWVFAHQIEPAQSKTGMKFGSLLDLDGSGDTLVVSSWVKNVSDSVHVFHRQPAGGWGEQMLELGATEPEFARGFAISEEGTLIAVGHPSYEAAGQTRPGRVMLYYRTSPDWSDCRREYLEAPYQPSRGFFGIAMAFSGNGDYLAVTPIRTVSNQPAHAGPINIFKRSESGGWQFQSLVAHPAPATNDYYGLFLAFSRDGSRLLIGAYGRDHVGTDSGAAYLANLSEGMLDSLHAFVAPDTVAGQHFGARLAMSADGLTLVVSATRAFNQRGTVYVFDRTVNRWWNKVFFGGVGQIDRYHPPRQLAHHAATTLTADPSLPPHQALLLAYWRMMRTPRALLNRLPGEHRQLYYRQLLGLSERAAQPDTAAVCFSLSSGQAPVLIPAATWLNGGPSAAGESRLYRTEQALLVNQSQWTDLRWAHRGEANQLLIRVAYDQDAGLAWPAAGVPLFESHDEQVAVLGRVISSPLLSLAGGTRSITLTLASALDPALLVGHASGQDQWLALAVTSAAGTATSTLVLTLAAEADALVPPAGLDGFTDAWPVLRLTRTDHQPVPVITALTVKVLNLPDVLLSTDSGSAKQEEPGEPFGHEPLLGRGLNVLAAEWYGKPGAIQVTLRPQWLGLPSGGFSDWYRGYQPSPPDNLAFKGAPFLASKGDQVPLEPSAAQNWFTTGAGQPVAADLVFTLPAIAATTGTSANPSDWPAWLRLELSGTDFQHARYWQLLAQATEGLTLNLPYTPQWKRLEVDYQSVTAHAPAAQYELGPFGWSVGHDLADEDAELTGELYLGFKHAQPTDTLSLYWHLQSPMPYALQWHYLAADGTWQSLDAFVEDHTRNLFDSGRWIAQLPADVGVDTTVMPRERLWIRGRVRPTSVQQDEGGASNYPTVLGLRTNAVLARREPASGEALSEPDACVPAGSISSLLEPLEGVQSVLQPWPSFGGLSRENDEQFLARTAERLSDRDRALTSREVVGLLRRLFPAHVHTVLPSGAPAVTLPDNRRQLELIVIPAPGAQGNTDRLRPALNPALLQSMSEALPRYCSPWVAWMLRNPRYRDTPVSYELVLEPGVNPTYVGQQVRTALLRHYMPWAFDAHSTVAAGGAIDYYQLMAFIQAQPGVQRVQSLTLPDASSELGVVPVLTFSA